MLETLLEIRGQTNNYNASVYAKKSAIKLSFSINDDNKETPNALLFFSEAIQDRINQLILFTISVTLLILTC